MAKRFSIIGIVLSIILVIIGIFQKTPNREIEIWEENSYEEYVGGDAYNIQIEASIRGGEIAGAKAAKATYISSGCILFVLSGLNLYKQQEIPGQTSDKKDERLDTEQPD